MSQEEVKANLPMEFKIYADTHVIVDCTELRCQTPSSFLLQSEMFSNYKSHCTMKALVGIAPHGPITFVSSLYKGPISDKYMFIQSGIQHLLTEDMAVMANKGFLIDDHSQMPTAEVHQTQEIARLRIHMERVIRRVKENKLFNTNIPLAIAGSINQLFTVACLLSNYQCRALVKKWAKEV
ncbi:unnamed protein product [Coregonus sp. 'balchen']|nr:unnamed protein product [Coregonus sp. 'balchen']